MILLLNFPPEFGSRIHVRCLLLQETKCILDLISTTFLLDLWLFNFTDSCRTAADLHYLEYSFTSHYPMLRESPLKSLSGIIAKVTHSSSQVR